MKKQSKTLLNQNFFQPDISALKNAEWLHKTFDSLNEAVFIIDPKNRTIILCNKSAEKMFGYSKKEMVGRNTKFLYVDHKRYAEFGKQLFSQLDESGQFKLEFQLKKKDGSVFLSDHTATEIIDDSRRIAVVSVVRDIQTQKETEKKLSDSENKYQELSQNIENTEEELNKAHQLLHTMFEGILDPLFMLDKNLNIKVMNKAAKEYYDVHECKLADQTRCFEFLKGSKKPCTNCIIAKPSGIDAYRVFERKGFKDPSRIEQVTIYPIHNQGQNQDQNQGQKQDGDFSGAIIRICDVTESKLMEQQLVQREKLASLGMLTSGIVHEINNPNNFIILNIPVLREYMNGLLPLLDQNKFNKNKFEFKSMNFDLFQEEVLSLLDDIELGAKRINSIISGMGKYVRERSHQDKEEVDLRQLIEKTKDICLPQIKNTVKSLTINIPEDMPKIVTDPHALQQVLVNLLINASHAVDKDDSWITMNAKIDNNDAFIIEVKDNGCGMDENTLNRIFDPFFTTKSPGNGTGLGLYLSYNIISKLGGIIAVQSEQKRGSNFTIRLPIQDEAFV